MAVRQADIAREALAELREVLSAVEGTLLPGVHDLASRIDASLRKGGKVLVFGNGGSAADAQHFAAELTGRYRRERAPLPAVALTTDTSALTAIGNDYGFEEVFARPVRALAARGDVAIGLTTSGASANVLRALKAAREVSATAVALTGAKGVALSEACDLVIAVPSTTTARIQEVHTLLLHVVCEILDAGRLDDPR